MPRQKPPTAPPPIEPATAVAARHRALLEAIPDLVFVVDRDGTYLEAHGGRELMVAPPEVFLGRRMSEVLPPEVASQAMVLLGLAFETGRTQRFEYSLVIEGEVRHFEARFSRSLEHEAMIVVRDRSEQHRSRVALEAERDFSRQVMEGLGQGLAVTNGQGRFEYVNPAFAALVGLPATEIISRTAFEVFETDEAWLREQFGPSPHSRTVHRVETRLRRLDGQELYVLLTVTPRHRDGRSIGSVTVFTDLTERRRMERAIQQERDFIAAVTDATNVLLVVVDRRGHCVQFNPAMTRSMGFSAEEISGSPVWELGVFDDDLPRVIGLFEQLVKNGGSFEGEFPLSTQAGERRLVSWSVAPLHDETGQVTHLVAKGVDFTERHLAETQARAAMLEAQHANQQRAEFFANVSHELRTPLHAIIGFTAVLENDQTGPLNPTQADSLAEIVTASEHLLDLINDLLDLSRVESGKVELHLRPLEVRGLLESSLSLVRQVAEDHCVRCVVEVEPGLETVIAGERQLKQVVVNLVSNAVKFTPPGGTVCLRAARAPGEVVISVVDSGLGIATPDLERIFEPFTQAPGATGQHRGFGLGLALTRKLVELHRGQITVQSAPGMGSTFRVHLPQAQGRSGQAAGKR